MPIAFGCVMLYNKYVIKEGQVAQGLKKTFKKVKKPLDKPPKMWYNEYIKGRELREKNLKKS